MTSKKDSDPSSVSGVGSGQNDVLPSLQETAEASSSTALCIVCQFNFLRSCDRIIMGAVNFTGVSLRITFKSHTNYDRPTFVHLPGSFF